MAVANIAQNVLTEEHPGALKKAVKMLTHLQDYDPDLTYREDMYPFIETSTFADDIKYHGGMWQSDFHFIIQPFIDQDGKTIDDYPDAEKVKTRNVTTAIENIVAPKIERSRNFRE